MPSARHKTERQKDKDRKTERQKDRKTKTERQKDNKIRLKMMNRTQKTSRQPQMTNSDQRRMGRGGWVAMSSRIFDFLSSMIYDLKISVDLR